MQRSLRPYATWRIRLLVSAALVIVSLITASLAIGEGSGTVFRDAELTRFRSHLEWRTTNYGGGNSDSVVLRRRTLLQLYAQEGETILLGSSGINVGGTPDNGDIRVFLPGQVTGPIGQEVIPALAGPATPAQPGAFANGFSCAAQRTATGEIERGRIGSREQELAGPLPNAGGYNPCVYVAPVTGIYNVAFIGPSGDDSNDEPQITGGIEPAPEDFGPLQRTSTTAWDVTVRDADEEIRTGRLFAYYFAGNTGGGARVVSGTVYIVASSGFRYRAGLGGDPFGFIFFANRLGFLNTDGTPLYRNLMAEPTAPEQAQNELRELQGGVRLAAPEYPIFVNEPDPLVLEALDIPVEPIAPLISQLTFTGRNGQAGTNVGEGGIFSFITNQPGNYYIVISRDGQNFDPTEPENRALRGIVDAAGPVSVDWDGLDNAGEPFPAGTFTVRANLQGGEVHFPFLDVENNVFGGPVIELVNPPDITNDGVGDCPPWNGGCFGAFYDDRGYRTADGTLIGTAVNGPLCPGDADNPRGFGNPPTLLASDPDSGYDTRTPQRAFGFPFDANPPSICLPAGGFGDKKGLDLWTFYPSNAIAIPVRIGQGTAITLRSLTATRTADGVTIRWETGAELNTAGFHILRSDTGAPEAAVRVTGSLIPARGSATEGDVYSWTDTTAGAPGSNIAYWLEEVETNGTTLRYGPVRPIAAPATVTPQIWLPLVRQ